MISIITSTYNRCHTLPRLWDSLCAQATEYSFEWVLVDDGSTDGTGQWFKDLNHNVHNIGFPNPGFTTRYVHQPNQGKHVALNTGVSVATGQWCFILDSDDALTPNAVERLRSDLGKVTDDQTTVGLCYRKQSLDGQLIGNLVYGESIELSPNEAGELFKGDLAYVFRTSALLAHQFPVFPDEKFVPELLVWNQISDAGTIRYYPETAIYLCEYLPDGYSANFKKMLRQNTWGFGLFYRDQVRRLPIGVSWFKSMIRLIQCRYYQWRQAR